MKAAATNVIAATTPLGAALEYGRRGFRVIPLQKTTRSQ